MSSEVFEAAEKAATQKGAGKRASVKLVLSIVQPVLDFNSVEFHLKGAKTDSDQQDIVIKKVDRRNGNELVNKEVVVNPMGKIDLTSHVERRSFSVDKFDPESIIKGTNTFRPEIFDGPVEDVPAEHVAYMQDGEEVSQFERTAKIDFAADDFVPLGRVAEYKFHETYMLKPNQDKPILESPTRIRNLARLLQEKQTALVGFFSWGRGFKFYTAIIYPYERKQDGKLWLCMGLAEGRTIYDEAWSLEATGQTEVTKAVPVVLVAKKPKVAISK